MVDLGGYVIILVETKDKKIKLYGSPADKDNLEVGDEILEVNGKTLEDATHTEVISYIHQCIRSRTICLRVKRRSGARLAVDLDRSSSVQDAFVIAVEQQARERLERLSALKQITPVDMTKLSQQLNQEASSKSDSQQQQEQQQQEINGLIESSPIYVTSLETFSGGSTAQATTTAPSSSSGDRDIDNKLQLQQQQESPQKLSANGHHQAVEAATTFDIRLGTNHHQYHNLSGRRASSPFQNGRTELLIGADDNKLKTTAVVENNNNKLGVDPDSRPRRRSGSSIVVLDAEPEKLPPEEELLEEDQLSYNMVVMLEGGGPHREMAVDVPDTFVARNKTPPRYPPPKPRPMPPPSTANNQQQSQQQQQQQSQQQQTPLQVGGLDRLIAIRYSHPDRERAIDVPDNFVERKKTPPKYPPSPKGQSQPVQKPVNGSAVPAGGVTSPASPPGSKPVPPPRDHLRIEKDGRLVNRAPAPQVPARIVSNNNVAATDNKEPTKEQLDSIRKFQEQLRKRKEEEERIAQQNKFLNSSLRGSRKLQALESRSQGLVNDGYSSEEQEGSLRPPTPSTASPLEREVVHTAYGYGDLVASLQRLQLQLKKASASGGPTGLEGRIAAVQSLLLSPQFGRALSVHNKVQEVRSKPSLMVTASAQTAVRECLDVLGDYTNATTAELADLLTGYEMEALIAAHDGVAEVLPDESPLGKASAGSAPQVGPRPSAGESYADENIKIIKIEKTNEPLGATVRNEGDSVIIGRVVRGGAAEKSGLLREGDELLEVNGVQMRGKSVNAVCDLLAGMEGTLTFLVVPANRHKIATQRDSVLHVKAHFDYDPEDDLYIPCRELGISFQKGDVLHIISQEDPNWWQAYREGEEDQTLAGLVPSQSFQHQRESMKQTISNEKGFKEKTRKSSTLLCARKTPKRKKKKGPYNEGGYPLYTSNIEDYDMDEILTYEEVALYYPRANHKRPIVLIGPPNIGRHELRQRLMEDAERFAAAIPHTSRARKDSEVDGQDYHFITRAQFEADILSRKFVEHGEYEKAYYGTSLDAIRSVVNSGKICVLNLHPQSLKILRTSDLKPYVVFVAPPSLEKLRQKKIRNSEAFKEEELKDIIEKAREMEDKYGHFFDMIIINNDTERAYHQLLSEINSLEREPQWVPAAWVKAL